MVTFRGGVCHGFRFWSVLLGCILFLAAGVRADESQPGNSPDNYHQPSAEGAGNRNALGADGKRRSDSSGVVSQFEKPPQKIDFFKLQQLQQEEASNRERLRKRVRLPSEAVGSQSANNLLVEPDSGSRAVQAPVNKDIRSLFGAALLLFAAGLIALHKLTPGFAGFTQALFNPWLATPTTDSRSGPIELAGDKFFSEFQARFRVDAPAPGAYEFAGLSEADILKSARRCVRRMQKRMQEIRLSTKEAVQRKKLYGILEQLQLVKDLVSHADLLPLQQMASALEPLIEQLADKTENITSPTIRTLGQGINLLADLCQPNFKRDLLSRAPLRFLVVDDEKFSRYALSMALKRTLNAPELADGAAAALEMASRNTYDLIFLDVNMPDMNGFELCSRIHETSPNQRTAVVFVTGARDFDTRVKSIVCGGRDLISKPFLTFELTVKALTMAARERLHCRGNLGNVPSDPA